MSLELTPYGSKQDLKEVDCSLENDTRNEKAQPSSEDNEKAERVGEGEKSHPFFNPWVYLLITCLANLTYLAAVGGYVSASLNTIERRFQLKSSESGAITIINDVFGMLSVLFVTHFAHSRHRPRIVGTCFALVGVGTILCGLPHFIYAPPDALLQKMTGVAGVNLPENGSSHDICGVGNGITNRTESGEEQCNDEEEAASGSLIWQIGWILFGQVLCGLGTCCQPLCITYLDDSVKNKRVTAIFVGIIFSCFAFGPTMGYLLATYCLAKPTYFYDASYPVPTIGQGHPYYIGAWWLGFLINGCLLILLSIPFFFFPKKLLKNASDLTIGTKPPMGKEDEPSENHKSIEASMKEENTQQLMPLAFFKGYRHRSFVSYVYEYKCHI